MLATLFKKDTYLHWYFSYESYTSYTDKLMESSKLSLTFESSANVNVKSVGVQFVCCALHIHLMLYMIPISLYTKALSLTLKCSLQMLKEGRDYKAANIKWLLPRTII